MIEPDVPKQLVVPALVEEQLVMTPQRRVNLTVLVEVRRVRPGAVLAVHEEDHALADVDEDANCTATPEKV